MKKSLLLMLLFCWRGNYNLDHNRLPTPVAYEKTPPYMLTVASVVAGYQLSCLGEL